MEISKAEFVEWKQSKVTEFVFEQLRQKREGIKEFLVSGAVRDLDLLNRLVASAATYADILDTKYSDGEDQEEPKVNGEY